MLSLSSSFRFLTTAALLAIFSLPSGARAGERILAIGDIHGAYEEFVDLLQTTGLIDEKEDWVGGTTRLVQTGDFTDRGSRVRDTIELLLKIERQAAKQGSEVHILLGNHEAMNLIRDDRDALVNPEIASSFADADSEERRDAAFEQWQKWVERRKRIQQQLLRDREFELSAALGTFLDQSRDEWLAAHPPGLIEYRRAMSADGEYGSWIKDLPVAVKLDDTLFLHAGIAASNGHLELEQINRQHRKQLKDFAAERKKLEKRGLVLPYFSWTEALLALEHQIRFPSSAGTLDMARAAWERFNNLLGDLFADTSPLWYRGYAEPPSGLEDESLAALLDKTDRAYGVRRTVAAHSPIADYQIHERLDGRVFLIDTGMLRSFYGGRASALEISAAGVSTIYAGSVATEESLGTNGDHAQEPTTAESLGTNGNHAQEPTTAEPARRVFYGPDGEPLPFQRLEDIERFLRDATPISTKPVGQGKTGASKILLELDGTRAHAVFHTIDDKEGNTSRPVVLSDGTKVNFFRDSYKSQVAVYELSKLIGMNNVPPTVVRRINGRKGSLAFWIENGINLFEWRERGEGDPKDPYLYQQMRDMRIFDNLIDNTDRNSQNIFWVGDFDVWLIDHTRALSQNPKLLRPDRVSRCSRGMFEGLRRLEPDQVRERLEPHIKPFEVKALLKRRDKVLELLVQRIEEVGEAKVIFEYGEGPETTHTAIDE